MTTGRWCAPCDTDRPWWPQVRVVAWLTLAACGALVLTEGVIAGGRWVGPVLVDLCRNGWC